MAPDWWLWCRLASDGSDRSQHGARIHLEEPVTEIIFSGRTAKGVRTVKGSYDTNALIINADFAHAMSSLVPNRLRRRWVDRKLGTKKFSCSTFMMYLGLDGTQQELPHHTIFLSRDYERNLEDIEVKHQLPQDPSIYIQNASVSDPTLAPKGRSTLYVLVPVPHQNRNIDWKQATARFRQQVIHQLEKIGIEDVERRKRVEHIITPADWEEQGIFKGATFSLAHNLKQMLHLRPRNRFEDLDAVYLVGGGTHPGSGLPTIYSSARITSTALMEDLGVRVGTTVGKSVAQSGLPRKPGAAGLHVAK